jgi:hypothetical protein
MLRAWAVWSAADADGIGWPDSCRSAERHWRAPAGSVFDPDRRPAPVIVPDEIGLAIDSAVTQLPTQMRVVVCRYYLQRRLPLLRDLPILQAAVRAVGDTLEKPRQPPCIAPEAPRGSAGLGGGQVEQKAPAHDAPGLVQVTPAESGRAQSAAATTLAQACSEFQQPVRVMSRSSRMPARGEPRSTSGSTAWETFRAYN